MLIETNTKMISLVQFNRLMETFDLMGMVPLSNFTGDSAILSANVSEAKILLQTTMTVGRMCTVMSYENGPLFAAYRANPTWT